MTTHISRETFGFSHDSEELQSGIVTITSPEGKIMINDTFASTFILLVKGEAGEELASELVIKGETTAIDINFLNKIRVTRLD